MAFKMLYPDEKPQVHRHSSIDQYRDFLSAMKKGGWAPIVFDQLDSITCGVIKKHPVIISFGDDLGFHFDDGECKYISDYFVTFDKVGVEQRLLPACMGGTGEMYEYFNQSRSFINFDGNVSLGSHNIKRLRVGKDYVVADRLLPPVEDE